MHIGCSGWNYKHWRGAFYPARLPQAQWLEWYAQHFDTVEINNSFYRLPEESTFANWRAQSPQGFVFAVKASRFLTHMKRLRDPDEPVDRLLSHAKGLGRKLGPVLFQLPARFRMDLGRLQTFLDALPPRRQHVIEFRDVSWYVPQVFDLLEHHRVALCLHDKEGSAIDAPYVGPFVYVRFHGPGGRYHGSYDDATLSAWAARLIGRWGEGFDVYAYFNNDPNADAIRNAAALKRTAERMMNEVAGPVHRPGRGVQPARASSRGRSPLSDDAIRT
jgi:uncharacterized protein YecE (DUF72 family)